MQRLAPLEPPYAPEVDAELKRMMPPGLPPIALFRTVAHNPRVLGRWRGGALLDKGSITLRQREIVILRATARLGAEYEWGVHVTLFAGKVGFGKEQIAGTVNGPADAACWSAEEQALLAIVDDLVDRRTIVDGTWTALSAHFEETQILEAIALVGYYHPVSFLCRGLDLPLEAWSARFPA